MKQGQASEGRVRELHIEMTNTGIGNTQSTRLRTRMTSVRGIHIHGSMCGNFYFGNFVNFHIKTGVYKLKMGAA